MSPERSASGTAVCGATTPCIGCVQRRSASTPVIRPSAVDTIGWYSVRSSPRASAPRRSRLSVARWFAMRCSRRSTVAWRAPPLRLAWYIAVSATWSTSSEPWLPRPANAMPTLALTCTSTSVSEERLGQRGADPGGERSALRRLVEVFAQDDELVAAETRQRVARPEHGRSSDRRRR